jgi:hypothetical protein
MGLAWNVLYRNVKGAIVSHEVWKKWSRFEEVVIVKIGAFYPFLHTPRD